MAELRIIFLRLPGRLEPVASSRGKLIKKNRGAEHTSSTAVEPWSPQSHRNSVEGAPNNQDPRVRAPEPMAPSKSLPVQPGPVPFLQMGTWICFQEVPPGGSNTGIHAELQPGPGAHPESLWLACASPITKGKRSLQGCNQPSGLMQNRERTQGNLHCLLGQPRTVPIFGRGLG